MKYAVLSATLFLAPVAIAFALIGPRGTSPKTTAATTKTDMAKSAETLLKAKDEAVQALRTKAKAKEVARKIAIIERDAFAESEMKIRKVERHLKNARDYADEAVRQFSAVEEKRDRQEDVRREYQMLQKRWHALEKHATETDQLSESKRKAFQRERTKIGDDYVDGRISKRVWRTRIKALEQKKASQQRAAQQEATDFRRKRQRLTSKMTEVKHKAKNLGVYLN